ncbi:MAG: ligand-binding sensor domain-containing protein, partial [Candidatus Kariarchaeaceae archaeon]
MKFIVLVIACIIPIWGKGPEYNVVRYTVEDGLSSNSISDICQDKMGYIWVCTRSGLDRFDGYEFRKYRYIPGDSTSIGSGVIWSALEDRFGNFWVASSDGLDLYNRRTDSFSHFYHNPDDSLSLSNGYIRIIFEDRNGTLWLGTELAGLNRLDRTTLTFAHYLPGKKVISLCDSEEDGDVWIGTDSGIYKYDESIDQVIRPKILQSFVEINNYSIGCILEVDKKLYFGTWGEGYYQVDLTVPGSIVRLQNLAEDDLYYDSTTSIIWSGGKRLFQHNSKGDVISKEVELVIKDQRFFNKNKISKIFKDKAGSFWIGTIGDGRFQLSELKSQFKKNMFSKQSGLHSSDVQSMVYGRDGHLWFSTNEGVFRLSKDRKSSELYMDLSKSKGKIILDFYQRKNGELWMASWIGGGVQGGGLYRFEETTGEFAHFFLDSDDYNYQVSSNSIDVLFEDDSERFWLGYTRDGLGLLDETSGNFINFRHEENRHNSLSSNDVRAIAGADSGRLWVGTLGGGLNLFDPVTNTAVHFKYNKESENCISEDFMFSLQKSDDSTLWIGTHVGGLNKLNTRTRDFTYFLMEDGLPSNTINDVITDLNGDVWVATEKGLTRIDQENEEIKVYDYHDGITNPRFTSRSCRSPEGEIFWGLQGGFMSFFPDSLKKNLFIPPVVITEFRIFNRKAKLDSAIGEKKYIILSHEQKVFSFEFAALNYVASERNQYRYKMEGFDQDWIDAGNRRFASYTNLDAGNYTFRILGSNNDGIWNEKGTSVKITILPPW